MLQIIFTTILQTVAAYLVSKLPKPYGNYLFFYNIQNKGNVVAKYAVTKALDRNVGIVDMYIGDMLWAISGLYLDI
jgi:hypothetical protein